MDHPRRRLAEAQARLNADRGNRDLAAQVLRLSQVVAFRAFRALVRRQSARTQLRIDVVAEAELNSVASLVQTLDSLVQKTDRFFYSARK
jgi:hypothetical protein